MPTRDQAKNWHEPLFAVRKIASEDVMPAPRCYAIYRETRGDNWSITALYHIYQESSPLTPKQFATWQSVNGFGGQQALDLALLVIREVLGSDGNITACELERRRGSIDGPFRGDPSRIEYRGGADIPKLFVSAPGNTLRQAEPSSISVPSRRRRSRKHAQAFYGEDAALSAHFGTDIVIIERRSPSLAEEMIGLTAIIRARGLDETHNRQGIGCGVGWFGPMPFILIADFPRLRQTAELTMATETAINTTLRDRDLVRHESRVDVDGPCVIACDRDRRNLFAIRQTDHDLRVTPYTTGRKSIGSEDQRRWIRYVEAHEGLITLDSYLTAGGETLVVLTGDDQGQVWHHNIDPDGVEIGSGPANDTVVAMQYRGRLALRPF